MLLAWGREESAQDRLGSAMSDSGAMDALLEEDERDEAVEVFLDISKQMYGCVQT